MKSHLFEQIYKLGIIPVIRIDNADAAVPLADALAAGSLPIAEITLHTEAALDSIRNIARELPDILVVAGTVINREQALAACEAGAKFLVSPGLDEELIVWAQQTNVPIIAGAVTPTEIMRAVCLGLTLLKFFPAEAMGGLKTIRSVSDPFPLDKVHTVGGSWMATQQAIHEARFDEIVRLAREASETTRRIRCRDC